MGKFKKIVESAAVKRRSRYVSICVAVLVIAAIVVTVFLLRLHEGDDPVVFPPPEPSAEATLPGMTAPSPTPPAAPPPTAEARTQTPAATPVPTPTEAPAETLQPTPAPTLSPSITPPAASAPPASASDITLHPVDPPADIQLE